MVDDDGVGEASVGAAEFFGHVRVRHRHTFDVRFVDDGFVVLVAGGAVGAPVEEGVNDHGFHGVDGRVRRVAFFPVAELVGEQ